MKADPEYRGSQKAGTIDSFFKQPAIPPCTLEIDNSVRSLGRVFNRDGCRTPEAVNKSMDNCCLISLELRQARLNTKTTSRIWRRHKGFGRCQTRGGNTFSDCHINPRGRIQNGRVGSAGSGRLLLPFRLRQNRPAGGHWYRYNAFDLFADS